MFGALAAWLGLALPAAACNALFLPSDAFFSTNARSLASSRPDVELSYAAIPSGYTLCGYSGFWRLRVTELSMGARISLAWAIAQGWAEQGTTDPIGPLDPREILVLAVAHAADLDQMRPGLRYNESLLAEIEATGHDIEGMSQSVEPSDLLIPPLPLSLVPDLEGFMGAAGAPSVAASGLQWVVASRGMLQQISEGGAGVFLSVRDGAIRRHTVGALEERL